MYILAILIEIISIYCAISYAKQKHKAKSSRIHSEKPISKQSQVDTEKIRKQHEKEIQQAEKARQKKEQAQADIVFFESQLNQLTSMLSQADNELSEIEKQIEIDYLMRSYDNASKKEKRKTQVIKQIMSLESRIHAIEARLAKANYIIQAV